MTTVNRVISLPDIEFNISQASRRGYASEKRLRYLVDKGRIEFRKSGRRILLKKSVLESSFPRTGKATKLEFLSIADLATKWGMSRQAVHKRIKTDRNMPSPVCKIGNGRTPLYLAEQIEDYEAIASSFSIRQKVYREFVAPIEVARKKHGPNWRKILKV